MNTRYAEFIETLTPSKRIVAEQAVSAYLKGISEEVTSIKQSDDIYRLCRYLDTAAEEHAVVVLMNIKNKLIKTVEVGKGGLTETIVDVRIILREALINNAVSIAFVHNHPSGNTKPSRYDDDITKALANACRIMKIYLIDHVIIGNDEFYSYHDMGKI